MTAVAKLPTVDELAQEIRRVDGNHSLGAGALAEALMPFLAALSPAELGGVVAWCQADDPLSRTAFSWPGTARNPAHTTPLYTTPRAAEAVTEEWTSELAEVIQTQTGCGDSDAVRAAAASIANINDWLALNPAPRAAVVTDASKAQSAWRRRRLGEIQRIIEAVDDRAMANDDEVPTTMQEMTQAEMSRIYDLSRGVNCGELAALTPPSAKGE